MSGSEKFGVRCAILCAAVVLSLASLASAADLAVLKNGFTIRHDHRKVMGDTTRLFLSTDESSFTDIATADIVEFDKDLTPDPPPAAKAPIPANAAAAGLNIAARPNSAGPSFSAQGFANPASNQPAPNLNDVVNSASAAYKLDPDLVNSVIHAESGFHPRAISPKGAQGLMQLMPQTANSLGVKNPFDPLENVGGGSHYLRELLERYNFDLVKALAAYNAGPERVEHYNGVPPYRETRAYVAHIVQEYNKKKIAQEKAEALARKKQAAANSAAAGAKAASSAATATKTADNTAAPGVKTAPKKTTSAPATHSSSTAAKHPTASASQLAASSASTNSAANSPR